MLQSISWSNYFLVIVIATILYYLFTWLVFFKGRVASLKNTSRLFSGTSISEDAPDEVMTSIQYVLDELRPLFAGRHNRSELLMSLQRQLAKYKDEDDTNFREIINQFIATESDRQCSIHLGEEDLRAVWL